MMDSWKKASHPSARQCAMFYLEGTKEEQNEIAEYVEKQSRNWRFKPWVKKRWKFLDRDIKEGHEVNIALLAQLQVMRRRQEDIDEAEKNTQRKLEEQRKEFKQEQDAKIEAAVKTQLEDDALYSTRTETKEEESIQIRELDFSVRATNALIGADILTVEDLCRQTSSQLSRLPNLGRKTLSEIELFLDDLYSDKVPDKINIIDNILVNGLVERIKDVLPQKDLRRKALKARIFEGATLQESAKILGLTRERVRQIEAQFFRQIRAFNVSDISSEKIMSLLIEKRTKPLSLWRLEYEEPWFEGITTLIKDVKSGQHLLVNILQEEIQIEIINQEIILSLKSAKTLEEINKIVKEKKSFDTDYKEEIRMIALINGREELTSYCIEKFEKDLSDRKASKIFVDSILLENKNGLRLKDIAKKVKKITGIQIDIRAISNAVNESPFLYLWGRIWRHENNFRKLDDEEIKKLSQDALLIMKEDPEKQWRTTGLTEELKDKSANYNKLTEYDIDWALRKSREYQIELDYRGRKAWGVKVKTGKRTKRKEIVHLALEALDEYGTPMKMSEIRKQIKKVRDIKEGQQIHAKDDLIHYSRGMLGIRDRDIVLNNEEQKSLFNLFELRLQTYPKDIFISNNAKAHILQTVADFEENNTFKKETLAIKYSRNIGSILNEIKEICVRSKSTNTSINGIPSQQFKKSFSTDSGWIDKQIRAKRKWSSIIKKNRNKIVALQKKLKTIEDQYGSDYRRILYDAYKRLDVVNSLDELWSSSNDERAIANSNHPKKITYYQLLRLLRMDKRFDVILSQDSYPEIALND